MERVVRTSTKSIEEYRHSIKLLKYHLKKEEKVNQTLHYRTYKKTKAQSVSSISTTPHKHQTYALVYTVNDLNRRTKEMGMVLGDVFRMADHSYEGEITKQQFLKTILRLKADIEETVVNEMFYAIDTDLNNNLSQDQYNQFLYAHGGCENKQATRYQRRSAEKMAAMLKKKNIKLGDLLNRTVDPCPADVVFAKLKELKLNTNQAVILLKMWDPSLKGEVRHEVYLKSIENVKQKDETDIQNEKFEKGVQELCVIFRDRKLNPIVIFEQAEADGKPGISEFELEQGLKKLLPGETNFQIRKWVNLINLNGDSQITREEFISSIRSFYSITQIDKYSTEYDKLHPELKRAINEEIPAEKIINQLSMAIEDSGMSKAETFSKIDINHNGLVDKEELSDGLKGMGLEIGLIAKVLTVFDRDASGEITVDQWLNILGEDVVMDEVDLPPPPPSKKKKIVAKTPKKVEQKEKVEAVGTVGAVEEEKVGRKAVEKKVAVNKTVATKKESLKEQDKNKTVKSGDAKVTKKAARPSKQATFAEDDSMMDSKTQVKGNNSYRGQQDEEVELDLEPIEREVGEKYGAAKSKVLAVFKSVVRTKKGISERELTRCLTELNLKVNVEDNVVQAIFEGNIASNGTFQYQDWLEELIDKYGIQVVPEKEAIIKVEKVQEEKKVVEVKKETKKPKKMQQEEAGNEEPIKQSKKRGEQLQIFQCLQNLAIKSQQHTEKGYKFSEYINENSEQVTLLNNKYLPLAQKLKNSGKTHKDSNFPTKLSSLTDINPGQSNIGNVSLLKWKHYSELFKTPALFDKGIEPNDIRQGELGDCYFLCSLASLAEYKHLIERIFEYIDIENGYFLVWLCMDGVWKLIEIDGYIPVKPDGKALVFSRCRDGDEELWVILLQKAYAKAYGCYQHIIGGQPYEAIKDLTGAPGQSYSHKSKDIDMNLLWQKLSRANDQKFMMTCGTDASESADMKMDDHSESVTTEGIVVGHAYSILDVATYKGEKLIQLRNPWGSMQWKGPWSDKSSEWTPAAKTALNNSDGGDDGIFWMPYTNFFQRYATTAINYIRPNYYYHSETKKNIKTLVVRIKASSLSHGFVMVAQQDHRRLGQADTPYNVCHLIGGNSNNGKITKKLTDQKYMYQREGCVEIDSSKVDPDSEFIILINLQKGTDITLCTYSDRRFQFECDEMFDEMLQSIQAVAVMEDGAKNVQTDGSGSFKSWLTSVGEYAFLVFKNISGKEIKLMVELSQPKNLGVMGELKRTVTLGVGESDTLQGKITEQKKPFSFGPMRFGMV